MKEKESTPVLCESPKGVGIVITCNIMAGFSRSNGCHP